MIRIVVENAVIFLLPTIAYIAWTAFKVDQWPGLGAVIRAAPLVKLFIAGAVLMLGALAIVATREIDAGKKPTANVPPPAVFTPETPTQPRP